MARSILLKERHERLRKLKIAAISIKTKKPKTTDPIELLTYNSALSGIVVLSFSELEKYVAYMLGTWVEHGSTSIKTNKFFRGKFPDNTKMFVFKKLFIQHFEKYVHQKNEGALFQTLGSDTNFRSLLQKTIGPINIDGSTIIEGKKYPSPDNLKSLAKRAGINSIYTEMGMLKPRHWQQKLTSLNTTRCGVAHRGELPVDFTPADVVAYVEDLTQFLTVLELVFKKHFRTAISAKDWKILTSVTNI